MLFLKIFMLILTLIRDNVNGELKGNEKDERKHDSDDEEGASDRQSRVLDALDDKEWHVAHLKEMDFDTDCKKETFDDKVKKYRNTLRNDGALVEFVSGDAIPVNKKELVINKCPNNATRRFKIKDKHKENKQEVNYRKSSDKEKPVNRSDSIKPVTVSVKGVDSTANINNQRRSEYQFSSAEYYDEFQDFKADVCPDTVEVIELQLDTLRSYDVVCEATLEWRSLE